MKKKGLIISTIVMVVVLIASLTTATYAWFNASSKTSVDQISLKIDALNAVAIGARTGGTGSSQDDYVYGTVTIGHGAANAATANDPSYTGDSTGLGTELAFASEKVLTLSTGVNSATAVTERGGLGTEESPYTNGSVTGAPTSAGEFNARNNVYKAGAGATDAVIDEKTILYANANEDYIALKMGAQASQTNVHGIYATVKVATTDSATTLKMNAAVHFYIRVANRYTSADEAENSEHKAGTLSGTYNYIEFDLFGSSTRNTTKVSLDSATGGATGVVLNHTGTGTSAQATAEFSFLIAGDNNTSAASLATDGSYITPFEIYAYVWGPDVDCVSNATGTALTIDIEFFGVQTETFAGTLLTLAAEA